MTKKRLTAVVAVAAAIVMTIGALAPASASAQEEPTVEGRGKLWADGTGTAEIDMAGRIGVRIAGDVTIVDHAGDLRVDVRSSGADTTEARSGDVVLSGFDGRLRAQGSGFSITIDGETRFRAVGQGQAFLDGEGVYKTRNGERTVWDGTVTIGDPEVVPAA